MATEYKLSYTAAEVDERLKEIDNLAKDSDIPTKISDLQNDSGFITQHMIVQPEAPQDTSVIWVDTDDNNADDATELINVALAQAKESGEFDGKDGFGIFKATGVSTLAGDSNDESNFDVIVPLDNIITNGRTLQIGDFIIYETYDDRILTIVSFDEYYAYCENVVYFPKGPAGASGYTPVKGTDYYTDEDKAEMVEAVIAALPVYNGEVE